MGRTKDHFVVVGGGHAGGQAVDAMRAAGFSGNITLVGGEHHLPTERPPFSKEYLRSALPENARPLRPLDWYADNGITLRRGVFAHAIDTAAHRIRFADGQVLAYDRLLLATGGRVRKLTICGDALGNIFYLRTQDDANSIRPHLCHGARLVVIGGGFIGLEVAATACSMGVEVTVVESAERLMERAVLPEISEWAQKKHLAEGVSIRLGQTVNRLGGAGVISGVVLDSGEALPAELVVVGIGIVPEVALAENAGIEVDNGIVVDKYCRTSAPDVFAAGDVTNHYSPRLGRRIRLESWQNAQNQAVTAGRNMCGENEPYADIPWFWSDQFDLRIECAGAPTSWSEIVSRSDPERSSSLYFQLSATCEIVGVQGVNGGRDMKIARRLIGKSVPSHDLADPAKPLKQFLR